MEKRSDTKKYHLARNVSMTKSRRRIVTKSGQCNIGTRITDARGIKFFQDIFTTLLDMKWRYVLLIFSMSFFLSWLSFGFLFWLIALVHGDLEEMHLPPLQEENNWKPCVLNINSFASCFLFSMESQHTIGYGVRATTEECPEAVFVMCMQGICGVMIQAFMGGIVFAKLTRSKKRQHTLLFSRHAVVLRRCNGLCLMFRVGDLRKSHIIGANIRAQIIRSRKDKKTDSIRQYQTELKLSVDDCGSDLFFMWPMTIVHKIDANSPLFEMSYLDMIQNRFEIVVILEGTIESTGQSIQARSSYLNSEILWGFDFAPVIFYNKQKQNYEIDYTHFDSSNPVTTPLKSSKELQEEDQERESNGQRVDKSMLDEKFQEFDGEDEDLAESDEEYSVPAGAEATRRRSRESADNIDWMGYLEGAGYNTAV